MKPKPVRALGVLLSAGLVLLAATGGCGGGGGGGGPPPDAFAGTYFVQAFAADATPPIEDLTTWGTIAANGTDTVTGGTVFTNLGGVLGGATPVAAFPFAVGPARRVTLNAPTVEEGGLSADGRVLALGSVTSGDAPSATILLRREGSFSIASLSGTYHACAFSRAVGSDRTWWGGHMEFDCIGKVTLVTGSNDAGAVALPGLPGEWADYMVAPDGTVTVSNAGTTLSGGMIAGGDLVVLTGTTTAVDAQILLVLVRAGGALNDATFRGSYHTIGLASGNAPPPRYVSFTGTSTADGAGLWTLGAGTANVDAVAAPSPAGTPRTYDVGYDGALTVDGGALRGAVSPSGAFAALAGSATPGGDPVFWFLVR